MIVGICFNVREVQNNIRGRKHKRKKKKKKKVHTSQFGLLGVDLQAVHHEEHVLVVFEENACANR